MEKRLLDRLGVVAEQTLALQLRLECMVTREEKWLACWLLLAAVEAFEHIALDALKGRRISHHQFVAALVAHLLTFQSTGSQKSQYFSGYFSGFLNSFLDNSASYFSC